MLLISESFAPLWVRKPQKNYWWESWVACSVIVLSVSALEGSLCEGGQQRLELTAVRSASLTLHFLFQMPKFFDLCSDSLWGIRKACAECFMMVSNSTSPEVRRAKLSPLFISLISDQSRWVRKKISSTLKFYILTDWHFSWSLYTLSV